MLNAKRHTAKRHTTAARAVPQEDRLVGKRRELANVDPWGGPVAVWFTVVAAYRKWHGIVGT